MACILMAVTAVAMRVNEPPMVDGKATIWDIQSHNVFHNPPPCNERTKVVPTNMSEIFPGVRVCNVDLQECETAMAYEPRQDHYAACQRFTTFTRYGSFGGLCLLESWQADPGNAWERAKMWRHDINAIPCPIAKGPIAEDVQKRLEEHDQKCKVELCAIAKSGKWSWTEAASEKPWPMSIISPTATGWEKMARKMCGGKIAGTPLYDVDRLKLLVTKKGTTDFNKNAC